MIGNKKFIINSKENSKNLINIIFRLIIIIFLFISLNKIYKIYFNKIKICLCTLGKMENNYVKEFIEHYRKYGVNKIFIYDNNDIDDEKFNQILFEYIKKGFVEIINYRGKRKIQIPILNHCYNNNYKKYDWFLFNDMDEYINLKNYSKIQDYLNYNNFNKCQIIRLYWVFHTDNDQLYYNNKSLFERFPKVIYKVKPYLFKPILRGNIINLTIDNVHTVNKHLKTCNGFGEEINNSNKNKFDFRYFYIDHFYFKSTEEFINKINRGSCFYGGQNKAKIRRIFYYFKYNKITKEKIKLFKNKIVGINNLYKTLNNIKNI